MVRGLWRICIFSEVLEIFDIWSFLMMKGVCFILIFGVLGWVNVDLDFREEIIVNFFLFFLEIEEDRFFWGFLGVEGIYSVGGCLGGGGIYSGEVCLGRVYGVRCCLRV